MDFWKYYGRRFLQTCAFVLFAFLAYTVWDSFAYDQPKKVSGQALVIDGFGMTNDTLNDVLFNTGADPSVATQNNLLIVFNELHIKRSLEINENDVYTVKFPYMYSHKFIGTRNKDYEFPDYITLISPENTEFNVYRANYEVSISRVSKKHPTMFVGENIESMTDTLNLTNVEYIGKVYSHELGVY